MAEAKTKINIHPLGDRVIVKPLEPKEVKKGGIIIPETAKEKPQEGEIVAAGKGRTEDGKLIPMEVKVGDKVLYGKYSGTEIKINDEEYLIMKEEDILGIVA
ncbi:MAG: co-chaperone GroES [Elusimicrobia bacterium]|nr:co-chaperone GroES [Elusimicrobiota bacterium]